MEIGLTLLPRMGRRLYTWTMYVYLYITTDRRLEKKGSPWRLRRRFHWWGMRMRRKSLGSKPSRRLCDQVITVYRYAKDRRQAASILQPHIHNRLCIFPYIHTHILVVIRAIIYQLALNLVTLFTLCTCAQFSLPLISQWPLSLFLIPYSCNVVGLEVNI